MPLAASLFEPVRLGVVGVGRFGVLHAQTAAGICETDLVAVVDPDSGKLDALPTDFNPVPKFSSIADALRRSNAEAWVVASPTATHVDAARQILLAGQRVLLEKPMATSLDEARSLSPLVKDDSGNLMIGHVMLFSSEFQAMLSESRGRKPLRYVQAVRHRSRELVDLYPGESPLELLLIHDLSMLLVLAEHREPSHFRLVETRDDEDRCVLSLVELVWEDGCVASLAGSYLSPKGMDLEGFDRWEVFGEGWMCRIEPNPRPIMVCDDRVRRPMPFELIADAQAPAGMLAEQLRCFAGVVRGRGAVPDGARYHDGLTLLRWQKQLQQNCCVC